MAMIVKTCSGCGHKYPLSRLVCLGCRNILEDSVYLKFVWGTLGIAVVAQLVAQRMGVYGKGFILEVLMNESALMIVIYPLWKVMHKVRNRSRPVFLEMGSVLSDRMMRVALLVVFAFALVLSPTIVPELLRGFTTIENSWPHWYTSLWLARTWLFIVAVPVVTIAAMLDQGRAFFDLRRAVVYVEREEERISRGLGTISRTDTA